jgi:hypothetical protein
MTNNSDECECGETPGRDCDCDTVPYEDADQRLGGYDSPVMPIERWEDITVNDPDSDFWS